MKPRALAEGVLGGAYLGAPEQMGTLLPVPRRP